LLKTLANILNFTLDRKRIMSLFKKIIFTFLLVASTHVYANSEAEKQEFAVKITNELTEAGNEMQSSMSALPQSSQSAAERKKTIAALKSQIKAAIQKNKLHIGKIQRLQTPKGGENLKKTSIKLLASINDLFENEMMDLINAENAPKNIIEQKVKKLTAKLQTLQSYEQEIQKAAQELENAK
jgi:hypothetical protein